jgi:hypothetical protein
MASTTLQKIESVAVTAAGSVVGALAGGPVGLGVGLVGGAVVDMIRARMAQPAHPTPSAVTDAGTVLPAGTVTPAGQIAPVVAAAMAPGGAGLPSGADIPAAANVVKLLKVAASKGHTVEAVPAQFWLKKFQTSVGLPATGNLDAASRAMLTLAVPDAANLPATTIIG